MARARQVVVISDLHLGGPVGFQMMRHPEVLARFIQELAADELPTELVIAGDFVDFLAEGTEPDAQIPTEWDPMINDPTVAAWVFERIATRSVFAQVFSALRDYGAQPAHRLTILLGNHDVELSYPLVRAKLCQILGVDEGNGLRFIYDGEAYVVGDALIEHGNRYDRWNQVDHDRLRQSRSLQSRGEEYERAAPVPPPAGSQLVAYVMNPIKRVYSFVDLLKPENEAVVPILLALEPGYRDRVVQAMKALSPGLKGGVARDGIPVRLADAASQGTGIDLSFAPRKPRSDPISILGALAQALGGSDAATSFLSDLPADNVRIAEAASSGTARLVGALLEIARAGRAPVARKRALLRALRALQNDRTWDLDGEDSASPYLVKARQLVSEGRFRYVIFGHTHHARQMPLDGGGTYFNSGTWAELMRVPSAIFDADEEIAFAAVDAFLGALDGNAFSGYTWFRPTYVRMQLSSTGLVGDAELAQVTT